MVHSDKEQRNHGVPWSTAVFSASRRNGSGKTTFSPSGCGSRPGPLAGDVRRPRATSNATVPLRQAAMTSFSPRLLEADLLGVGGLYDGRNRVKAWLRVAEALGAVVLDPDSRQPPVSGRGTTSMSTRLTSSSRQFAPVPGAAGPWKRSPRSLPAPRGPRRTADLRHGFTSEQGGGVHRPDDDSSANGKGAALTKHSERADNPPASAVQVIDRPLPR